MVEHVDQSQQAGILQDTSPKNTASTGERGRQRIISFKVGHALLTVFFLWLT
jgi:hypothetical protein